MRKFSLAVALALGVATSASAAQIVYTTELGPEAVGATGSGSVRLVFDDVTLLLDISADWVGLSGTTTVAHMHCCTAVPFTGTAGVAVTPVTLPNFPVGLQAGSYDQIVDLNNPASFTAAFLNGPGGGTVAGARAAFFANILQGRVYFNIHTTAFPGGEIRGFLAVPEPVSLSLVGIGLTALALRRRRARR